MVSPLRRPMRDRKVTARAASSSSSKRTEGDSVEDRYLNLRDEHLVLKRKSNEQENTIKKLRTKLGMIDETLKRRREVV